jgi:pimeloyl-ACP methyl ester carboxylesterase
MWAPFDFIAEVGPGIYFAAPYDPKKTPVLFVHGITGTPRNFVGLAPRLDATRLQPWFLYYPSGARLDAVADVMAVLISRLHVQYGFRELYVVAHSMGGLVARAAILSHAVAGGDYVTRFVSIATPWSGHPAAQRGIERAPAVVRSWLAMAPASAFLEALFHEDAGKGRVRRRLPAHVRYDLVFAYRRALRTFGESSDSVIRLASQLRPEAQEEAEVMRGFDDTHVSVLDNPETATLLNALLRP